MERVMVMPFRSVVEQIESLVQSITTALSRHESISIPLRCRSRPRSVQNQNGGARSPSRHFHVSFPGKTAEEARRFTIVLFILDAIHAALIDNVPVSKRNIYYRNPALFKNQSVVDHYVDVIAQSFGMRRMDLNVHAASKGLYIGMVEVSDATEQNEHGQDVFKTCMVPETICADLLNATRISWILIVEKESAFRVLAATDMHRTWFGQGLIITAKGYPDLSTRHFIRAVLGNRKDNAPVPLIFTLMDYDPDGVGIMLNYKYGSANLAHENEHVTLSSIVPLVLSMDDVVRILQQREPIVQSSILGLTVRDRLKAISLLQNKTFPKDDDQWRNELQAMLMLNVKVELESLMYAEGGMDAWVRQRMLHVIVRG